MSRKIDGKVYRLIAIDNTKTGAKKIASDYRKKGRLARIFRNERTGRYEIFIRFKDKR